MSKYFKAKTVDNISLNKHFRLLNLSPLSDIDIPQPGQFYMLQTGDTCDPLLKRPFSIFRHEENSLSFLYRIRGKGTLSLSRLKSGDIINAIGPLGNSYPVPDGDFIALAGGIGIASLLPLMRKFKERAYLFYGARSKEELVMMDEAKAVSKESFITTDDGSEGKKGLITDSLMKFFNSLPITHHPLPLYACGPTPMLRELYRIIKSKIQNPKSQIIECYVSMEEYMACGVGVCLGCVVKVRSQEPVDSSQKWIYKRVCKEGPVFDIKDIIWE